MTDHDGPTLNTDPQYWAARCEKLADERDEQRRRADNLYRRLRRFTDPALPPVNGVLVVRPEDELRLFREGAGFERHHDGTLTVRDGRGFTIALFDTDEWAVAEFVFSPAGDQPAIRDLDGDSGQDGGPSDG